jgi:hypothetical protein
VRWEPADWKVYAPAPVASPVAAPATLDAPLPLPDKPSIAVLPFQNMSGDPEQEYFADGMVEDIITALSRFKSLFVIARNSSFIFMASDVRQVGRELGVLCPRGRGAQGRQPRAHHRPVGRGIPACTLGGPLRRGLAISRSRIDHG